MKVFNSASLALADSKSKAKFYLNSTCPYNPEARLCGSWCALFYIEHAIDNGIQKTSSHVILGCKAGEKHLFVSELVEK